MKKFFILDDISESPCRYAAGAIGSAITETFIRDGARVFMAGRNEEKLKQVAKNIDAPAGMIYTAAVDALDEEAVNRQSCRKTYD